MYVKPDGRICSIIKAKGLRDECVVSEALLIDAARL